MQTHHRIIDEAPERQKASVEAWLAEPEFQAKLQAMTSSHVAGDRIAHISAALEAARAVVRLLEQALVKELSK